MKTYLVNDHLESVNGSLELHLMDFKGRVIWTDSLNLKAPENTSTLVYEQPIPEIDAKQVVLLVKFNDEQWLTYFSRPKNLKLTQGDIIQKITKTESGFSIELSSDTLQKEVFLFTNEKGHFKDNFFDLLPNEVKQIEFITAARSLEGLKIKTLNQFVN